MKHFFSKYITAYTPKYLRSLVYMLQSTEYDVRAYMQWFWAVPDFKRIEYRKSFSKTKKSLALLAFAQLITIALFLLLCTLLFIHTLGSMLLLLCVLIFAPIIIACAILVPLYVLDLCIQRPIEFFILRNAQKKLRTHKALKIAIAGSYGKTSMREILKTVLSENKIVAAPPHSYNTPLGISTFIGSLTGNEEVLIFEFGEYYPGDISKLADLVDPDIGVITGINEAHLEKFKTIESTIHTIFELADSPHIKRVYVNAESAYAKKAAREDHILYDALSLDGWNVSNSRTGIDGTSFTLSAMGRQMEFTSQLLGLHQIGPLLVAIAIAKYLDFTDEQVIQGVSKTKPFEHRLEPSIDSDGVIMLDDSYNGNPDGVKAVIDFLALQKDHRRFYVTPGLVEMGHETKRVHTQIGEQLAKAKIEKIVLIRNSVTPFIAEGLQNQKYEGEVIWFDDPLTALQALQHLTVSGDVVLLQNDWPDQYR